MALEPLTIREARTLLTALTTLRTQLAASINFAPRAQQLVDRDEINRIDDLMARIERGHSEVRR